MHEKVAGRSHEYGDLRRGFSLLELSISLFILTLVMSGALTLIARNVMQGQIAKTDAELDRIDESLQKYVLEFNLLPCPAPLTAVRGDAEYGRSAATCDGSTAGLTRVEYPAGSSEFVVIGGVPFYTLHLPDKYLADEWRGRYLYAVSEDLITAAPRTAFGNILVQDDNGAMINDEIAWVVVSHGPSREGAFRERTGVAAAACDGGNLDGENCDGDGVFKDAQYNDGDNAALFFDDFIRWESVMRLYSQQAY